MPRTLDALDARLLALQLREPRVGVLEASRRLGVARGTVQARLDRLVADGVIATLAPTLDPGAMGYPVTAFVNLEISQGGRPAVIGHLDGLAQVLEVHTITGQGDLLCRVVARDNDDLQHVVDQIVAGPGVLRTSTVVALACVVAPRWLPLVLAAADARPG